MKRVIQPESDLKIKKSDSFNKDMPRERLSHAAHRENSRQAELLHEEEERWADGGLCGGRDGEAAAKGRQQPRRQPRRVHHRLVQHRPRLRQTQAGCVDA